MNDAVKAHVEEEIEDHGQVAPSRQLDKLKDSTIEGGHRPISRDQADIRLEKKEQIERAEREAAPGKAHRDEFEPGRTMEQAVEKLQEPHRSLHSRSRHAVSLQSRSVLRLYRELCYRFRQPKLENVRPAQTIITRSALAEQLRLGCANGHLHVRRRRARSQPKVLKLEATALEVCFWKLLDMQYDCVIATRNQLNALRMSIPLILKQDVSPGRLIVIDASDDHDSVRTEVHEISERLGFKNTIVAKSDASNSARQRNMGLQLVEASVVMLPDDNSMWYCGFAANILKIYEADVRRQVGGVTGVGVPAPPPELGQPTYKKSAFASAKGALQPYRSSFENRFFPHPFGLIAAATWTDDIDVVDDAKSKRVPHITGFRMSFRTDAVRQAGFDRDFSAMAPATPTMRTSTYRSDLNG